MTTYDNLPGVDDDGNFPPDIRQAFSESPELLVAIANKIANDPTVVSAAATMAQSTAGLVAKWKANTSYVAGQWAINPSGDIVVAKTNFVSGATYSATNWDSTAAATSLQTLISTKIPDLGRLVPVTPGPDTIDNYKTQGFYKIYTTADAIALGLPYSVAGRIFNYVIGSYVQQSQFTIETPSRQINRLWNGTSWGAWGLTSMLIGNLQNVAGDDKARTIDGLYIVASTAVAITLGLPEPMYGTMERLTWSSANIVRWTFRPHGTGRSYEMSYENGVWSNWRPGGAGVKLAAVALTTSGPIAISTQTAVHGRVPIKIAVDAYRYRFHFRNYNYRMWTSYPGSLSFLGATIGEAILDGGEVTHNFKSTPESILGPLTTNVNAGIWSTPWVNKTMKNNTPYLMGYAYNSPAQNNFASVGGGWLSSDTSELGSATATMAKTTQLPLDIWMEVEVDADTRIIAYLGDSLTAGVSADLPVYDSWANRHALKQGALPLLYGFSGDGFGGYVNAAQPKLTKWAHLPRPNVLINALGSNNIFQGNEIPTIKTQMKTALDLVTAVTTTNLYHATILPRYEAHAAYEANRKLWNEYLQTDLPYNAVATFEAAEKFVDLTGDLLDVKWGASSTDFHLKRSGYARYAAQVPSL